MAGAAERGAANYSPPRHDRPRRWAYAWAHGEGTPWATGSRLQTPTGAHFGLARRTGRTRRAARWSSSRKSSASTPISAASSTASPRTAITAIAPALFDHFEHHVELGYDEDGVAYGPRAGRADSASTARVDDVARGAATTRGRGTGRRRSASAGAARWPSWPARGLGLPAVSYYGGRTVPFLHERPERAAAAALRRERPDHPAGRHRQAPRGAAGRGVPHLAGRPRLQLRPARRLQRRRWRRRRCSARWPSSDDRTLTVRRLRARPAPGRGLDLARRRPAVATAADGRRALPLAGAGAARAGRESNGSTSTRERSACCWPKSTRPAACCARSAPCDKLNIGALGNIVRQLHVHVVAREGDAAWPGPVWGCGRVSRCAPMCWRRGCGDCAGSWMWRSGGGALHG